MEIVGLMQKLKENFGVVHEKSETILMRSFFAGEQFW